MAKQKEDAAAPKSKLERKEYEKELRRLQAELCLMQDSVKPMAIVSSLSSRDAMAPGRAVPFVP